MELVVGAGNVFVRINVQLDLLVLIKGCASLLTLRLGASSLSLGHSYVPDGDDVLFASPRHYEIYFPRLQRSSSIMSNHTNGSEMFRFPKVKFHEVFGPITLSSVSTNEH